MVGEREGREGKREREGGRESKRGGGGGWVEVIKGLTESVAKRSALYCNSSLMRAIELSLAAYISAVFFYKIIE